MRILIFNWRDIKNPLSGGAEILTHEMAKRWIASGHEVFQFSSAFPGAALNEVIDGIKITRRGNCNFRNFFNSVYFLAFLYYKKEMEGKIDFVIDEIHGIPFFTPCYIKEKKIALICEVAGPLWVKIFGPFFGAIGILIEKFYLRFIYRSILYLTISQSTKKDLIENGVKESRIHVLPMGFNTVNNLNIKEKEKNPTLIFVGRLTVAKGIEDTLLSFKYILEKNKNAKLWIVGRGEEEYVKRIKKMAKDLKLEEKTFFFGYIPEEKKFELLSRAHILIHPSMKEGFGLTIPEAGYVGTPVIAYNSPGLRDIVKKGINGILLKDNFPSSIASEALSLLKDKVFYKKLSSGAKKEAKKYDWSNTAKIALSYFGRIR